MYPCTPDFLKSTPKQLLRPFFVAKPRSGALRSGLEPSNPDPEPSNPDPEAQTQIRSPQTQIHEEMAWIQDPGKNPGQPTALLARADVRQHRIVLSVGRYDPPAYSGCSNLHASGSVMALKTSRRFTESTLIESDATTA